MGLRLGVRPGSRPSGTELCRRATPPANPPIPLLHIPSANLAFRAAFHPLLLCTLALLNIQPLPLYLLHQQTCHSYSDKAQQN